MGRPSPYTDEFKAQAVDLVRNTDRTQTDVAASLGINKNTLSNWVTNARSADKIRSNPAVLDEDEQAELARLRKENRDLRQDRDILRKAAAYFASETIR
mgnify:CR=1 FL=1